MPKTLETCKKKHVLFNSKSFKVIARRLKQQRFYLSLSLSVVAIILEINKKGKNAASLALNRCWFKNPSLLMTPLHLAISNFKKKNVLLLTKDFFSRSFHSCKFFHDLCKKCNLKGNSIKLSTLLKYGLTEVKKARSWMFDLVLNMLLWT